MTIYEYSLPTTLGEAFSFGMILGAAIVTTAF
jgi:hypothetical protein